jgi:hypothetical protein
MIPDDSPHVHAEHPLPVGERAVPQHAGLKDAGVVAQQVHGAERLVRPLGERFDRGRLAHVRDDADRRAVSDRADRLLERSGFDVGRDDAHPLLGAALNQAAPDAAAGTRHDGHLAGKFGEHDTSM